MSCVILDHVLSTETRVILRVHSANITVTALLEASNVNIRTTSPI